MAFNSHFMRLPGAKSSLRAPLALRTSSLRSSRPLLRTCAENNDKTTSSIDVSDASSGTNKGIQGSASDVNEAARLTSAVDHVDPSVANQTGSGDVREDEVIDIDDLQGSVAPPRPKVSRESLPPLLPPYFLFHFRTLFSSASLSYNNTHISRP